MTAIKLLSPVLLALAFASAPVTADSVADTRHARMVDALYANVLAPASLRLATAAQLSADGIAEHCAAPDESSLRRARERFLDHLDAWHAVQPFEFGPLLDERGPARLQYWPDRRGTGARQLRSALIEERPSLLKASGLASASVALADLQALEQVLFDHETPPVESGSYRCRYAIALSAHQASLAQSLAAGFGRFMDPATPHSTDGTEPASAATGGSPAMRAGALLRAAAGALEITANLKLGRPLGRPGARVRPRRAEHWRSGASLRSARIGLAIAHDLLNAPDGVLDMLREVGESPLAALTGSLVDAAVAALAGDGVGLDRTRLEDPQVVRRLRDARSAMARASTLLGAEVASALETSVGFSSRDGD